jgi:hypothetical protein
MRFSSVAVLETRYALFSPIEAAPGFLHRLAA